MRGSLASLLAVSLLTLPLCSTFNIFDEKTNFVSFVRTKASLDPTVEKINYGNGTVFARFPGQPIKKIFYFEGFNIGRKIPVADGFQTVSREIFVYRDLETSEILSVWLNPFTGTPNEVFDVANDPIDNFQTYDNPRPTYLIRPEMVSFSPVIFLQTTNDLDPRYYPNFSAGPVYEGVEIFYYYSNLSELATSKAPSVNFSGSWYRKGQFLPWMELGDTDGCLFYHQTTWKSVNGFDDVAADLLELVMKKYPKYLTAPKTFEDKMVTSWDVFKETIDRRRAEGKPDIILPLVQVKTDVKAKKNSLDKRLISSALRTGKIQVYFNGSVFSEIIGNTSIQMFNIEGTVSFSLLDFNPEHYKVYIHVNSMYRDPNTGKVMHYFKNPFTRKTEKVQPFLYRGVQKLPLSSAFSYPLPGLSRLTVLFDNYSTKVNSGSGVEDWAMDMLNVFVDESEMTKKRPKFYGSWARFSSWLPWLQMESFPGNMVWRSNFYRV